MRCKCLDFRGLRGLVIGLGLWCSSAHALSDVGDPDPQPGVQEWKDGWSFLAGVGASRSRFITSSDESKGEVSGLGPNLSTSIGYCDRDAACLEFGSLVSFNLYNNMRVQTSSGDTFVGDVNMWETALYLSLRTRVPGFQPYGQLNPWIKILAGYGASVGFFDKVETPQYQYLKNRRIQTEGPLFGVSLMNVFQNPNRRLWYLEGSTLLQMHWKTWLVESGGLLPDVTTGPGTRGNPYSLVLALSAGVRIF